jgi:nucleoid-associated protein YgaU
VKVLRQEFERIPLAEGAPDIVPRSARAKQSQHFKKEYFPMTDQELKNKYQPVADFMSRNGFNIQHFHVENGKAVLTASAPTEYLKDRVWDEIKKVDPNFTDLQHEITIGSGTMYVVKSGDSLSKISKSFYGNANEYRKIAQANNISDPDKIQAGQELKIPAA